MTPHPTGRSGLLRIPGPGLSSLQIRFSPLADRDHFDPQAWPQHTLSKSQSFQGWWEFDLDSLKLPDGPYEYEFVVNENAVVADPYATEITRFGGYRGIFTIAGGKMTQKPFRWDGEFPAGRTLPQNNEIVIYEMPIKWMASDPGEDEPLAELGTFDKVIFEHLDDLAAMGINCIELLPVEDSPQTLNWGYGTRFFFTPDYDIGSATEAKFFVKSCHQRGIRVVLDVVMNMFAKPCPLSVLAPEWFREASSPGRQDWGQNLFRFNTPTDTNYFAAREFLCEMAEFWVSEYHIDGYRIDDFADINNWDFVQEFQNRATAANAALFPGKPFLVIAEDSNRRFVTTADDSNNPNHLKVVDAIWNFGFRDESRRLATDSIQTVFGQPSRSERVRHLITKDGVWNDWNHQFDVGYTDLACSVNYATSHDVADGPRMMNILLGPMLLAHGLGDGGVENVRSAVDNADGSSNATLRNVVDSAFRRCFGVFAILTTSVGIPMFLAGEEFGDVHDTGFVDVNRKQQDPVQWGRAGFAGNRALQDNVAKLVRLRTSHPALQRNEVESFYFHPDFDADGSPRVFAYCRTAGKPVGSLGQVVAIANMGAQPFPQYDIPAWPWGGTTLVEIGYPAASPAFNATTGNLSLSLDAFAVRVFTT